MTRRGPLMRALAAVSILVTAAALVQPADAQVTRASRFQPIDGEGPRGAVPNRLASDVGVTEHLGHAVPEDLTFLDEQGREVRLSSLFEGDKPVALAFVYHSCPMLCSLILDGVTDAVAMSDLDVGEDYEVLAVSFDPRDTPARADSAKARYLRQLDGADADDLHFWTIPQDADEETNSARRLAEAVGFGYAFDPQTDEYAHNAALILLSPQGVVTRYLYGIQYEPRDFRLAIVEAGQGTVGSTLDKFLLTCYEYDDDARSYSLAALGLLKVAGGFLVVLVGGFLFVLWRREGRDDRWSGTDGAAPAPAP